MDLNEARERIREVDEEMAALFVRRMEAVEAVAIPAAPSKVNPSTRKKAGYLKVPAFFSIFTSL